MALLAVLLVSAVAGGFGSMVGIGGGLIMVPVLSQVLGYDIKVAIAASLIGVIAGSISASPRFLASGIADRRVAVTLLVATVIGGLTGGVAGTFLDGRILALLFGVLLLLVAAQMAYRLRPMRAVRVADAGATPPTVAAFDSSYVEPRTGEVVVYGVQRLRAGTGLSFVAGNVSGLLGVGGGVINVPTMNVLMNVPLRVATTTSTLMLGATAMTSAMVAAASGTLDPLLAAPVVLGVLVGSRLGARLSMRVSQTWLSIMFIGVALFFAAQTFVRLL